MYTNSPIYENHAFLLGLDDQVFTEWKTKGIKDRPPLYINGHFMLFEQLQRTYNIPASNFFRYLQIQGYIRDVVYLEEVCPP